MTSCVLFAVFGLGALLLSPLMLLLRRTERCQPVVRATWKPLVWLFVHTGLIRVDRGNLPSCRGSILVSNHPSLIDVVLYTVLLPQTLSVAKRSVGTDPFMGAVARAIAIPVGAEQIERLSSYLQKGWNILVFPEGTRSPFLGTDPRKLGTAPQKLLGTDPLKLGTDPAGLYPFRRGAAQLALRSGAPVVCVGVRQSRRILAKGQPAWDMGTDPVEYRFRADRPTVECPRQGETLHAAAVRLTAEMERRVKGLLA